MRLFCKMALSVVAVIATTGFVSAQSFYNTPNDSIYQVGTFDNLHTLSIQQVNLTSDSIILQWQKVSESLPADWEASVCDNANCNTTLLNSGTMAPIVPGEYGLILIHITPYKNAGTAIIKYAVWDIATPTMRDTLTYILTVNATSSTTEIQTKNTCSIFPNPASENIFISTEIAMDYTYLITDAVGRIIQKGDALTTDTNISTRELPNGIYSLSIFIKNKHYDTTKFVIQH